MKNILFGLDIDKNDTLDEIHKEINRISEDGGKISHIKYEPSDKQKIALAEVKIKNMEEYHEKNRTEFTLEHIRNYIQKNTGYIRSKLWKKIKETHLKGISDD